MKIIKRLRNTITGMSLMLMFMGHSYADLVMSAPPREKPVDGVKYYGPIATQLSEVLGEKVTYQHPITWHTYSREMRAGKYDIVFDGPHFAAWRMANTEHVPVVRLPGSLRFVILAHKTDDKVNHLKDLIEKEICGLASPNLGTLVVNSIFHNPVIQPNIRYIKGGMKTVMKKFLSGDCPYAVVRDKVYFSLPADKKALGKIIVHSKPLPNQTITVNVKMGQYKINQIRRFMTSELGAKTAADLLARFSKKKRFFIKTDMAEYSSLDELLHDVVYGW